MRLKTKIEQGFTIIELMMSLAIIGVLAMTAIPAYTGYMATATHTAAYYELNSGRNWMETHLFNGISVNHPPEVHLDSTSNNCSLITTIGNSATGIATMKCVLRGVGLINGKIIIIKRDGAGNWGCTTTADEAFSGAQCRNI